MYEVTWTETVRYRTTLSPEELARMSGAPLDNVLDLVKDAGQDDLANGLAEVGTVEMLSFERSDIAVVEK